MRLTRAGLAAGTVVAGLLLGDAPAAAADSLADAAGVSATGSGSVVVNEFAPSGRFGSTDEYVELANTSEQTVALAGWDLSVCLSPATSFVVVAFGSGAEIPAGGHMLLAHFDYPGFSFPFPDLRYGVDVPDDGGWLLSDPFSGYTDGVGLRSGLACTEGSPAPACNWTGFEAVTRDQNGTDTDDNGEDFSCQARTPGS